MMFERIKTWIAWSEFKANQIKMTPHQIKLKNENKKEQQWKQLILTEANRMEEKTGMKIEDCLATINKLAEANKRYVAPGDLMIFDYDL